MLLGDKFPISKMTLITTNTTHSVYPFSYKYQYVAKIKLLNGSQNLSKKYRIDPVELEMIFFLFANLNTITITLGTIITCHILLSTDDVPSGPGLSV